MYRMQEKILAGGNRMIHWIWAVIAFVLGTWLGIFTTALFKANNPEFSSEDPKDPEDDI